MKIDPLDILAAACMSKEDWKIFIPHSDMNKVMKMDIYVEPRQVPAGLIVQVKEVTEKGLKGKE